MGAVSVWPVVRPLCSVRAVKHGEVERNKDGNRMRAQFQDRAASVVGVYAFCVFKGFKEISRASVLLRWGICLRELYLPTHE